MSANLNKLYGSPGTAKRPSLTWQKKYLRTMTLPYPMRLAWDTTKTVTHCQIHYKVQPHMESALWDIWNYCRREVKEQVGPAKTTAEYDKLTMARVRSYGLDLFGGTYNHRLMVGGTSLSTHSYGIAIDMDPTHNALGTVGRIGKSQQWVVTIFKNRGFAWGGEWKRKDPMHMELAGFPQ